LIIAFVDVNKTYLILSYLIFIICVPLYMTILADTCNKGERIPAQPVSVKP